MVFGEEIYFSIINPPPGQSLSGLVLKFRGNDKVGLKMKGDFSELWTERNQCVEGPTLHDEEHTYRVAGFDYHSGILWLNRLQ